MNCYFVQQYWKEFRLRIIYCFIATIFSIFTSLKNTDIVLYIFLKPLHSHFKGKDPLTLVYLDITDAFFSQIYLSIFLGILITLPFIWLQLFLFFNPALQNNESKTFIRSVVFSLVTSIVAFFCANNFLIPSIWTFFLQFNYMDISTDSIKEVTSYTPGLYTYVKFLIEINYSLLIASQMPNIIVLLLYSQWLRIEHLWHARPWLLFIILLWSTALSSPEPLSQLLLFLIVSSILEFSVLGVFIKEKLQNLN